MHVLHASSAPPAATAAARHGDCHSSSHMQIVDLMSQHVARDAHVVASGSALQRAYCHTFLLKCIIFLDELLSNTMQSYY